MRVEACLDKPDAPAVASAKAVVGSEWSEISLDMSAASGVHALYLRFENESPMQFEQIEFA